jgi:hypothetical protein
MKLKQIILMILSMILLLLSGCTGGSSGANENIVASKAGADLNSISGNQLQGVVPAPRFYAQPHSATQYYTSVSNTTQYQAFSIGGSGVKAHITSISLEDNSLFEIESDQALYGVNQCQVGMTVTSNPCEILIHAINPFIQMQTPVVLSIIVNGILYKKTVSKSGSYAYIAGDFTQSYQNGNTAAVKQSNLPSGSNCGPKGNAPCQILLYDFQTESLSSFATTDSTVNDMAIDSDGNLYIGGMFNTIVHQGQSLSSNMQQPSNLLVKMLNTGDGYIAQDWLRELSGGGVVNYPNDAINAISFDPKHYQLYVAGSFNSMANYTSSSSQSFPILQLGLNSETNFKNALGLDINNPNAAISAVGVDESSNLYLSGFYGTINQFKFNNQQSAFSINKCPNLGNEHSCLTGSSYSISINGFKTGYKNQPAYNLTFQPNGALYAAGGFTNMFYEDSR